MQIIANRRKAVAKNEVKHGNKFDKANQGADPSLPSKAAYRKANRPVGG